MVRFYLKRYPYELRDICDVKLAIKLARCTSAVRMLIPMLLAISLIGIPLTMQARTSL